MDSNLSSKAPPVLSIKELFLCFEGELKPTSILLSADLEIQQGEIVGLVGPSGIGKSSLAKAILGILPRNAIHSGSIAVASKRPREFDHSSGSRASFNSGSDVAYLAQEPWSALNPALSIWRQFSLAIRDHHPELSKDEVLAKILHELAQSGLVLDKKMLNKYPHEFSGGEMQRIAIALSLLHEPKLYIADEPTSALDATHAAVVMNLIVRRVRDFGTAALIISHDRTILEKHCDRLVSLDAGKLIVAPEVRTPTASIRSAPERVTSEPAVIKANGLGISIPKREFGARTLFANLDIELFPSQTLAITGASGSGKTTLARVIAGLQRNFEGELSVANVDLRRGKFSKSERRELAMVFQDSGLSLNPKLRVGEIITEPLIAQGNRLSKSEKHDLVMHSLAEVGLSGDLANRHPASLSVGQRQRVSIARALTLSPSLVIADEPTSSLDADTAEMIMELFASMQKKVGFALVLITHDLELAKRYADEILEMDSFSPKS